MKWNSGVLTDEQIIKKINENYRNLSEEDMQVLLEYYRILNTPRVVRKIASHRKRPVLLIENGKYIILYLDKKINYVEELAKGTTSLELDFPGGIEAKKDFEGSEVGMGTEFGGSASAGGSIYSGQVNNNFGFGIGNVDVSGSFSQSEVGISASASLVEGSLSVTIREDDLYSYGAEITVTVISAEISASLSSDGFEIGASTGLIGINVSGGQVELIDINVDM